ncbi:MULTISPECIES: hypothetical protein [Cupriavidus]
MAVALFAVWYEDYCIDLFGRTATAPVRLYRLPMDAWQREGIATGTIEAGTRCRLLQVDTKGLVSFRVKCGPSDGWTTDARSFTPPLGIGLFGN